MTLLNTLNVGGTDFGLLNNTVMGVCVTPAGSEVKACSFADNFELKAGVTVTVKFTYANTYGDGSTTYPKLTVNGTSHPIKYTTGAYAGAGAWVNGQTVAFLYDGTNFIIISSQAQSSITQKTITENSQVPAQLEVLYSCVKNGVYYFSIKGYALYQQGNVYALIDSTIKPSKHVAISVAVGQNIGTGIVLNGFVSSNGEIILTSNQNGAYEWIATGSYLIGY